MGYGIWRYLDMETWGDDIIVFAHKTPCQGHHTRTYARVTTRDAMPRPTHRAPCQGHRTRKHVRATQGTMPGKCHEEIFQSRYTGDHVTRLSARATARDTMSVPSQEKTYQGHHTRKHVKAITREILSVPSHEKA